MRLLLDTHAVLWWLLGDPALGSRARRALEQTHNDVFVSAVSAWEIAIKARLGKLPRGMEIASDFGEQVEREGFQTIGITCEHGIRAGLLPGPHEDPFDRMLIAQAQAENLLVVSRDEAFDGYGVRRIW